MNVRLLQALMGFALFWTGLALLSARGPNDAAFLLTNLIAFVVVWGAAWVEARSTRFIGTLSLMALVALINAIGRAGFLVIYAEEAQFIWYFHNLGPDTLLRSSALNLLFNLALVAGYGVWRVLVRRPAISLPVAALSMPEGYRPVFIGLVVLAGVGTIGFINALGVEALFSSAKRAVLTSSGERIVFGHYVLLVAPMLTLYLIALANRLIAPGGRRAGLVPILLAAAFVIWWAYFRSIRGEVLLMAIATLQVFAASGRSLSLRSFGLIALAAGSIFALMSGIRAEQTGNLHSYSAGTGVLYALTRPLFGELNLSGPVALWYAFLVVPAVLPYSYGLSFLQFVWLVIPRALWPEKPLALGEVWLNAIYPETALRYGGGLALGLPGEAVLAFGTLGLVAVPLLFGMILAATDRAARAARTIPALVLLILLQLNLVYSSYGYYFSKGLLDWSFLALPLLALRLSFGLPLKLLRGKGI